METFLYFFLHLGVPLIIVWSVVTSRPQSKVNLVIGKIFQIVCLLFLFLWGQYPLVGSYYFRYFLLLIVLLTLVVGWVKWSRSDLRLIPKGVKSLVVFGLLMVATPFISYLTFQAYAGLYGKNEAKIELSFPLKNGKYYVSSGGKTSTINNHFRNYANSQQFAIDINQVNKFGSVSGNILASASDEYFIFGKEVFSPCSGVVKEIRDAVPDNTSASMHVDHTFGKGNYIDLECKGFIISIYHLQQGSVLVNKGDEVVEGELLGKVGNSGFSLEPHLHIQAAQYNSDSVLVGVPVKFDNQWLVRNSLIDKD